MKALIEKLNGNKKIGQEIEKAVVQSIIKVAKENGFNITAEEIAESSKNSKSYANHFNGDWCITGAQTNMFCTSDD